MESIQSIYDQIPIQYNFFSQIILLGMVQGFFLAFLILIKTSRKIIPIKLLGFFFLMLCLVMLDGYLCYTGLMKYCIGFNDSTEPLVLLWAPLMYLCIVGILEKKEFSFRANWYHFLVPFVYFLSQIGYYTSPESVKVNAYISAYFPEIQHAFTPLGTTYHYQLIKDELRWIIIFSFAFYLILSLKTLVQNAGSHTKAANKKSSINKYDFSRYFLAIFFALMLVVLGIFLNFENDRGDHYIGIIQTFFIFTVSFMIYAESRFFERSWIADKYDTLKTQNPGTNIEALIHYVESNKYFLKPDASLKDLAQSLDSNPNYISKIINANTEMNFNDFLNKYRIELAKKQLVSKDFQQFTIEAIGSSVGFNSKSAFYKAFKKHTQTSPTAFVKKHQEKTRPEL